MMIESSKAAFSGCACGNKTKCCSDHGGVSEGMVPAAEFREAYSEIRKQYGGASAPVAAMVFKKLSPEVQEQFELLRIQRIIGGNPLELEIPRDFAALFLEQFEFLVTKAEKDRQLEWGFNHKKARNRSPQPQFCLK